MHELNGRSRQTGFVLVVGLLLLLIITIIAIAAMSSGQMQERMAGNARTQALAFQAASTGASDAINLYIRKRATGEVARCRDQDWGPTEWWPTSNITLSTEDQALGAHLFQRMYCVTETLEAELPDGTIEAYPSRAQLFVLSRGQVLTGPTVVAQRDIEVRLVEGFPDPLNGCSAICMPGCTDDHSFQFPNSGVFRVDGGDGPSITTSTLQCAAELRDHINDLDRIDNYGGDDAIVGAGGSPEDTLGWPWDEADQVASFADQLRILAQDPTQMPGMDGAYIDATGGTYSPSGSPVLGTASEPQLTFIEGNATMSGNVSGNGILVVTGELTWQGTPNWNGLILVLGGSYTVSGGGRGGLRTFGGSLVGLNLVESAEGEFDFAPTAFDLRGGGNAQYNYNCDLLQRYALESGLQPNAPDWWRNADGQYLGPDGSVLPNQSDETQRVYDRSWTPPPGTWWPPCNIMGGGDPELSEAAITSWRENLGWRDVQFFAGQ